MRLSSTDYTKFDFIQVENYTFDQDVARKELAAMIILHEYPLSMVDHAGFQRFVSAHLITQNLISYVVTRIGSSMY